MKKRQNQAHYTSDSLAVQKIHTEERATVFCVLPFTKKVIKIDALRYAAPKGSVHIVAYFKAFGFVCRVEVSLNPTVKGKVKNMKVSVNVGNNISTTSSYVQLNGNSKVFTEAEAVQKALELASFMIKP